MSATLATIVNGTDGVLKIGKHLVPASGTVDALPVKSTNIVVNGVRVALKDASTKSVFQTQGVYVFQVHTPHGEKQALYISTTPSFGHTAGTYISPTGVLFFNKTDGGAVPGGFAQLAPVAVKPVDIATTAAAAAAAVVPAPVPASAPTPVAPVSPFVPTVPTQVTEAVPCDADQSALRLAGLTRIMGSVRQAQAMGDYPPVRLVPKDATLPTRLEFLPSVVTAKPPGIASANPSGMCAMSPAEAIASHGSTLVAAPLRPQDVLDTFVSEGPRYRGGLLTHPRGAVPLGYGQATLNLAPVSEWALCRKENVERINHMMDRLADLQIAAMTNGSPL